MFEIKFFKSSSFIAIFTIWNFFSSALLVQAQAYHPGAQMDTINNVLFYTGNRKIDSVSKNDLFYRTMFFYLNNRLISEGSQILFADKEECVILVNSSFNFSFRRLYTVQWTVHYKMLIQIKDGAYRYELFDLGLSGEGIHPFGFIFFGPYPPMPSEYFYQKDNTDLNKKPQDLIYSGIYETIHMFHSAMLANFSSKW